jgi:Nuclease-related domain
MDAQEEIDPGVAGRSAQRESERRRERRQLTTQSRSRLLNVLVGPSAEQKRLLTEQKRWSAGAQGEEMLAEALTRRCPTTFLLHDRRIPGSRANIDHIAVTAGGVFVIDAKRYRGKIEVREPLFGEAKLMIAGRNRTRLVEGLAKQVAVVKSALADVTPEVSVHGCFCFLAPEGFLADSSLPLLRTLKISGYPLYYPRRLAKQLNRPGPLTPERAGRVLAELARKLPPA